MYIRENIFHSCYGEEFQRRLILSKQYADRPDMLAKHLNKTKENNIISTRIGALPSPKPDRFAYEIIKHRGFATYPYRLKNFILAEKEQKGAVRLAHPTILDIEPTTLCNFSCVMCQRKDWSREKQSVNLDYGTFKDFVDNQTGLTEVKLQGIGEPLFNKCFIDMVEYLVGRYIWVRTTVNGSLLHMDELYKKIIDSGINEIQVSFDGASKEVFENIRRHSKFERIVKNLTLLNQYANKKNILVTRLWALIQKSNQHEIFDMIELAKRMKFRRMTFSMALSDWGQAHYRERNRSLRVSQENLRPITEKLRRAVRESEIDITFWDLGQRFSAGSKHTLCPWPFSRAFVSAEMKIVPCCMVANSDIFNLGDANDFHTMWNGEKYRQFRKAHLDGKIPTFCQNCYKEQ